MAIRSHPASTRCRPWDDGPCQTWAVCSHVHHPAVDGEAVLALTSELEDTLIDFRRDLHAHPELGFAEFRTTERIVAALRAEGLEPTVFTVGTGVRVDIDPPEAAGAPRIALRADIDALPVTERTGLPYASTVPGMCHACGHDVHTTVVLGTALVLARLARRGRLRRPVRMIFQPSEERQPGGAAKVIAEGALDDVAEVYALHCDPKLDLGRIGLKDGALTSATDMVTVRVTGPGGHTSRPHLSADVVGALSALALQTPLLLSRRVDPRGGVALVWGRINAGSAPNVIPGEGELAGTLRALDLTGWQHAGDLLDEVIRQVAAPFGVEVAVDVVRFVPPTVNDLAAVDRLREAATAILGPEACSPTGQSLGGEDFAWMTQRTTGAMARLGVRTPGRTDFPDIHQGNFVVDERAIAVGVRLLSQLVAGTA